MYTTRACDPCRRFFRMLMNKMGVTPGKWWINLLGGESNNRIDSQYEVVSGWAISGLIVGFQSGWKSCNQYVREWYRTASNLISKVKTPVWHWGGGSSTTQSGYLKIAHVSRWWSDVIFWLAYVRTMFSSEHWADLEPTTINTYWNLQATVTTTTINWGGAVCLCVFLCLSLL